MQLNVEYYDIDCMLVNFLNAKKIETRRLFKEKDTINGTTIHRWHWRDLSDRPHFGSFGKSDFVILGAMDIEVRYVKNVFFSISVKGDHDWTVNEVDRDYFLNKYLKSVFAELEPHIGQPQKEPTVWNPIRDTRVNYIEFEWRDERASKILDAFLLISAPRIGLVYPDGYYF